MDFSSRAFEKNSTENLCIICEKQFFIKTNHSIYRFEFQPSHKIWGFLWNRFPNCRIAAF